MPSNDYLTVRQSALKLGVSETAVRNATLQGRLPYSVLYGRKLVATVDLQSYKDRTQPRGIKSVGRPPKNKPENTNGTLP